MVGFTKQDKDRGDQSFSRGEKVVDRLRTDHLNDEETESLHDICFDYQNVFYLPRDRLKIHKRGQAHHMVGARGYPHKYTTIPITRGDRGGTVVKVLCYKSQGR